MKVPPKTRPAPALLSGLLLLIIALGSGCASSPRAYHQVKAALPPPAAGQGRVFVCLQKGALPYQIDAVVDQRAEAHPQPGEFLYVDLAPGEHEVTFLNRGTRTAVCSQRFRLEPTQPVVIELLCSGGEQVLEMPSSTPTFIGEPRPVVRTAYNVRTTPLRWSSHLVPPEQAEQVLAKYTLESRAWERLQSCQFSPLPEERK